MQPLCGPSAVWTPPRGGSTTIFGDGLQDLTQKRQTVDMWTSCSLIILEAAMSTGPVWGPGHQKDELASRFGFPLAHWGEPFRCPRDGVRYSSGGCGFPPTLQRVESGVDCRPRGTKRMTSKREVDGGGFLEEVCCPGETRGRPNCDCMPMLAKPIDCNVVL